MKLDDELEVCTQCFGCCRWPQWAENLIERVSPRHHLGLAGAISRPEGRAARDEYLCKSAALHMGDAYCGRHYLDVHMRSRSCEALGGDEISDPPILSAPVAGLSRRRRREDGMTQAVDRGFEQVDDGGPREIGRSKLEG